MKLIKSKKALVLLALAIAAVAAVGAYAYWTNSGSGTGSAATGTNVAITVNQTSTSAGTLYPGGPTEALSGNFTNTNAGPVHVASVSATVTATSVVGCNAADFYITGAPAANVQEVAPGTGGSWSGLAVGMTNTTSNQDPCKNATLTISYTSA